MEYLLCTSFGFLLIIAIVFFAKAKIKNEDTKIYTRIIIVNLMGLCLDLFQYLIIKHNVDINISKIVCKVYLVYVFTWTNLLFQYIANISTNDESLKKFNNFFDKASYAILIIGSVLVFISPIEVVNDATGIYSRGMACVMGYLVVTLDIILMSLVTFINIKSVENKSKYVPFFVFLGMGTIATIVQALFPNMLLITPVEAVITLLTYFYIENPDMKVAAQLNEAKLQAEKANNAKTDFLSSMSHEIRTPLNAIVGFSQALMEENLPSSAQEEVKYIVDASETLLEIVNSILDISKIEANKLEIIDKEYNFKKVYDELCALTKARLGEKPLELRFSYDDTIPQVLYGDDVRIKQIILNLLTNSIKYTKYGFVDFSVKSVIKGDMCRLIISVEDSGIGIKKENLEKLFTKFERFEEKNTTIEGTGLGLAITKRLVELMHGQLVVHSVFGEGSKFTLVIDQKIVKGVITIDQAEEGNFVDINCANKEILLVDDNKLNLKVAARLLETYKANITMVESGAETIDLIKSGKVYDLILMDDMMPKMSGVETFKELKKIPGYNIPTVILTANAIEGMRDKYLNDGFDDYLSKPINKIELNRVINRFLNK